MRRRLADTLLAARRAGAAAADRPRPVLAVLVVAQWFAVLGFALTVKHNGWLYYQGGDEIWYATSGWFLGHLSLPYALVGYGWSLLLAPVMLVTGRDVISSLPSVILLDVVVLGPVALGCVYVIAARVAGRALGLFAAAAWVAGPYLAIPLFRQDYHERFVEQFLPQALGLTAMADYPSMVCLLVAAALVMRALETNAWTDWTLGGLAAGVAVGMKPANLLFLAGPALAVLLARRIPGGVAFVAGLVPSLVTLTLWKYRGLGTIPAFSQPQLQLAAAAQPLAALNLHRYVNLDWDNLHENLDGLREWTWSARLLVWAPFAGTLAVARRSRPAAGLLAGWFWAFLIVKGTTPLSTVESGSFFRYLMPAFPGYFLLLVAIPLLIPREGMALARRFPVGRPVPASRMVLLTVAVTAGVLPLLAIGAAAARPVSSGRDALEVGGILTPVDPSIHVTVRADRARRIVTWNRPAYGPSAVFYHVFRTEAGKAETSCDKTIGAAHCLLVSLDLGSTRTRRYVDRSPPAGSVYRIGVAANWEDNPAGGDVIALSEPTPGG